MRIWNLLSVISPTRRPNRSAAPNGVSRLFGQLAARRHCRLGWPDTTAGACADAGVAASAAAPPNSTRRRFTLGDDAAGVVAFTARRDLALMVFPSQKI